MWKTPLSVLQNDGLTDYIAESELHANCNLDLSFLKIFFNQRAIGKGNEGLWETSQITLINAFNFCMKQNQFSSDNLS